MVRRTRRLYLGGINMDAFMKGILSRVLSDEIRNQQKWKEDERKQGFPDDVTHRDANIAHIKKFMEENDIPWFEKY